MLAMATMAVLEAFVRPDACAVAAAGFAAPAVCRCHYRSDLQSFSRSGRGCP